VFQRPFGSVPVEDGGWVYELSVYVHLNPLRIAAFALSKRERQAAAAGLLGPLTAEDVRRRLAELRCFRWSSYRAYAGYAPCPAWLTTSEVLRRAGRQTGQQAAAYRKDVQDRLRQGAGDPSGDGLRDELAIGSVAFAERVKRLARATGIGREAAGRRRLAGRATWADVVRAVARAKNEPWASFCDRYGDPGSSMALWLAQRYTGLRLREIGAACGGRDYSAVSVAIKRHAVRLKNDSAVTDLQRKAEQLLIVEMSPQ
jgi:hypothetical protein